MSHDFGLVKLGIQYTFPEDEGVYQLRVSFLFTQLLTTSN